MLSGLMSLKLIYEQGHKEFHKRKEYQPMHDPHVVDEREGRRQLGNIEAHNLFFHGPETLKVD